MSDNFRYFNLRKPILKAIEDMGFEVPTPVQEEAIPLLLEGEEVMAQAQTGTGKTAAFGISILQLIEPSDEPLALVVVPTRELARQVSEEINELASHLDIHSIAIYGGASIGPQIEALKEGREIVVGTPGRLIDHLNRKTLSLNKLRFVVLDEADRMLDMGFIDDIEKILSRVPRKVNMSLFSATIPPEVRRLGKKYMENPKTIIISEEELVLPSTEQAYINVGRRNKIWALCRIIDNERPKAIVFCSTKRMVDILTKRLKSYGYPAEALHGDFSQNRRESVLDRFKKGDIKLLIASDVAARGLDIQDVTHVINYDIPDDPEMYVHRIGRTGRAGNSGNAITFVSSDEQHLLKDIKEFSKAKIEEVRVPETKKKDKVKKVLDFEEKSDIFGMVTFSIDIGEEDGMRINDIADFIMKKGGLPQIAVGDIEVSRTISKVEIHKDFAWKFFKRGKNMKFKGRDVKLTPLSK